MLNKVLVALDGSDLAECVLSYVESLAASTKDVTVLQVVPTPRGMSIRGAGAPDFVIDSASGVSLPTSSSRIVPPGAPHGDKTVKDEGYWYQDKMMERAEAEAKDYLVSVSARLADKGFKVEQRILFGHPAEQIVDFAEKSGTDMIVMSTHGRSGLTRWAFGDTADKVLRASPVPVLLIRAGICPAT